MDDQQQPHADDDAPLKPERYEMLDSSGNPLPSPRNRHQHLLYGSIVILAICVLAFFFINISAPEELALLTFSPANGLAFPGLISHMFVHANLMHLLMNMLVLYFLGSIVEIRYGMWRYLVLYFGAGIIAALAQAAAAPAVFLLGASGALSGVMAAFARHFPQARLLIWGIVPLPAWLAAILWLAYNLFGVHSQTGGVAYVAHLAGFFSGIILSLLLIPPRKLARR